MKPILPKGSIALKISEYSKSYNGIGASPGVTIMVLPTNKSTLKMSSNSHGHIQKQTNSSNVQISESSNNVFYNSFRNVNDKFGSDGESVFILNEQRNVLSVPRNNSGCQIKNTSKSSMDMLKKNIRNKINRKKMESKCLKLQKEFKDRVFLYETKVRMKEDNSSSVELSLKANKTSDNFDNRYEPTFFNDLCQMSKRRSIKSNNVSKDKNKNDGIDAVSIDKEKNNFMPNDILTRTENPPSYEAHFSQSPSSYIGEISNMIPPAFNSLSKGSSQVVNGTRYFPPPYFSTYLDDKCDDANNAAFYHENDSKAYSVESIPQENCDYYLNNYDEEPKDYSNYSGNSISQLKKKELDASKAIEFIRTFTDRAVSVMNQSFIGNEAYQKRQKCAMEILSGNPSNQANHQQSLKDNFWILEDEPLIDKSMNIDISYLKNEKTQFHKSSNCKSRSKEYVCHICGKILSGSNSFTSHLNRHLKRKCYQCQYCVRKFSHICSLKYHIRTHTGENPYSCQICSKSFKSLSNLNKHLIVHSQKRLFKCSICSKSFKTKISQQIHIKKHSSQSLTCKFCHCIFKSRKSLTTHIQRKHKDQKLFTCQDCGKSYQYQCLLNQHARVHSNELCYNCHLCNAAFVWRSGLASHLKTHSFKLQCEICSSKFTSLKKLDKHRYQHSDPFPHKCVKCKREFKYAYLLKNHLVKHKDDLVCETCNVGFITKTKFKKHLKHCVSNSFKSLM